MSESVAELELRPKPLGEAFLLRFGESREQARRRLLTVALPAAAGPVLLLVVRSYRSAQEDGVGRELVTISSALLVVAVLVGMMFLAHARQRIAVTSDAVVVRSLWRTRRHPRHEAHRAVSMVLTDLSQSSPTTFVLDKWGNCLVAMSWTQFERTDVEHLVAHLRVPHAEELDRELTIGQMRRRYPGAFTFSRRHPWATGFLACIPIVAFAAVIAVIQTR